MRYIDKKIKLRTREIPQAAKFSDYREMISHMGKNRCTSISTPDHTHAHAAHLAMSQYTSLYTDSLAILSGRLGIGQNG